VASYILSISTSTAILENLAVPKFDLANRRHNAISECSRHLHQATAADQPIEALEEELDRLGAELFGIAQEQLSEIKESYRELTKADLRDAREAEAAHHDEREAEAGEPPVGPATVLAVLDRNGEMTVSAIADATEIDVTALRPLLRQLVEGGTVEQTGGGRRFRLTARGEA
jgi:hypothetical protein